MFTLTIATDNAAFDGDAGPELARILTQLADVYGRGIPSGSADMRVRDANGNTVGRCTLEQVEEEA